MEEIFMSLKECNRLHVLKLVESRQISQVKAAEMLAISDRQVRNLLKSLSVEGEKGVVSKKRGVSSNRKYEKGTKNKILELINKNYNDFGPKLAAEKLQELHEIKVSRETVRKWMIETHLWIPKTKKKKIHYTRQRKEHFGEMLQGDGSHHDWFETGKPCALVFFIDDATSIITAGRFEEQETLAGYVRVLKDQIERYGAPHSIYTDRFSVFESSKKKENLTQFRRMLGGIGIAWIGANSPQAKGRIERCNRTLQDRLVKELRINGIKTIEEGNIFLKKYIDKHNEQFSKKPMKETNFHRPLDGMLDFQRTLSKYDERTTRKDLTFQFHGKHYQILEKEIFGKKLEIRTDWEGNMRVFQKDRELSFKALDEIFEEKIMIPVFVDKNVKIPEQKHPWREASYKRYLREKEYKKSMYV